MKLRLISDRDLSWVILCAAIASLAFTVTRSATFPGEPAFVRPQPDDCREVLRRGFPAVVCDQDEMLNSAWGDSLEYFVMASGRPSYPPYALRPLYPQVIGAVARLTLAGNQDPARAFERISQVAGVVNIVMVGLLAAIPLWYIRAWSTPPDGSLFALILLNVVHIGVLQTSPFFMLDIPTYVIFTIAAGAFFSGQFAVLCAAAALGVLIKEMSIVLLLPMAFLWWMQRERRLARLPALALPVMVFIGIRFLTGVDPLSVQYGWNLSKGDLRTRYLMMNLGGRWEATQFLLKLSSALGGPGAIALLLYVVRRAAPARLAVCLGLTGLVVLADVLLASRVPRVVAVCVPFLVFYSMTAYRSGTKPRAGA